MVIVSGKGAVLRDVHKRKYLTTPILPFGQICTATIIQKSTRPVSRQLKKIAHSSALGLANEPASLLAEKLVQAANQQSHAREQAASATHKQAGPRLEKVFFSDDGSTALRSRP